MLDQAFGIWIHHSTVEEINAFINSPSNRGSLDMMLSVWRTLYHMLQNPSSAATIPLGYQQFVEDQLDLARRVRVASDASEYDAGDPISMARGPFYNNIISEDSGFRAMQRLESTTAAADQLPGGIYETIPWETLVENYDKVKNGNNILSVPRLEDYDEAAARVDMQEVASKPGTMASKLQTMFQKAGFQSQVAEEPFSRVTWAHDSEISISEALYGTGNSKFIASQQSYNSGRANDAMGLRISELRYHTWKYLAVENGFQTMNCWALFRWTCTAQVEDMQCFNLTPTAKRTRGNGMLKGQDWPRRVGIGRRRARHHSIMRLWREIVTGTRFWDAIISSPGYTCWLIIVVSWGI